MTSVQLENKEIKAVSVKVANYRPSCKRFSASIIQSVTTETGFTHQACQLPWHLKILQEKRRWGAHLPFTGR